MHYSLRADPTVKSKGRIFRVLVELSIGLLLSWLAVAASYRIEAIRTHYPEMTSFAPLGLILAILLSPVWLGLRCLLRYFLPNPVRSAIAFLIPTITVYLLSMLGICELNRIWMLEPVY